MKLAKTDVVKKASTIDLGEGVYMKGLPMAQLKQIFEDFENNSEENPEDSVNDLFDAIIVDSKGAQFEDLVDAKATELLSVEAIQAIMANIGAHLNPDPK